MMIYRSSTAKELFFSDLLTEIIKSGGKLSKKNIASCVTTLKSRSPHYYGSYADLWIKDKEIFDK